MTISGAPDSGYHERAMTHGTNIIETHREGVMSTREDARADQVGTSEGIGRRTVIGRSLGVALAGSVLGATGLSAAAAGAEQSSAGGSGIALPQGMRRVVTGHDAEGKSYIVSDERVTMGPFPNLFKTTGDDPFGPGPESLPRTLLATDSPGLEPEVGGAGFVFVTLPPTRSDAELRWHRTETVDIDVVLGGELILMLDKEETTLHPGDAVIQRNTMHAWKNPTDEPVYWVAVLVPIRQRT